MNERKPEVRSASADETGKVVVVDRTEAPDEAEAREEAGNGTGPGGEPCSDCPLTQRIEALLLSSDRPLTDARLGALLGLPGPGVAKRVREAIGQLNEAYEGSERAFRIKSVAGGWQVLTRPAFGELLARLHHERQQSRLSQAALETLSVIAYRQPIIRAEIEAVRGVSCGEVLRGLLERRLIKIVGRAEELGRPMLYGTTREFLKVFGLASLEDLPEVEGLKGADRSRNASGRGRKVEDARTDEAGAGKGEEKHGENGGEVGERE